MPAAFGALFAAVLALTTSVQADEPSQPALVDATAADINEIVAKTDGVVLVNVWATWCAPCVEEFPALMKLQRTYGDKGLRMVFVSADFRDTRNEAEAFLSEQGVDFDSYFKIGKDEDFINGLHQGWNGALPATFIFDRKGALIHFIDGPEDYETFERLVLDALDDQETP